MAEAGILREDDRVELIDGEIVEMAPIGDRHATAVDRTNDLFVPLFRDVALTRVQNPIRLGEHHEPQPDFALVRRRPGLYASGHPAPEDIFLIVEVADTSVDYDRQVKVPLYARGGVPETWLVDLPQAILWVYREPTPDGYRSIRMLRRGDRVAPAAFPDRELAVDSILG
jgi:Uma2 family endonuclease